MVRNSTEFQRIRALPRRFDPPAGADRLTELFRLQGRQELRPIQAQALAELCLVGGLLGIIRVGGGKTLITFLASAMVPRVKRPLLLIPAKLRGKTRIEFAELERDWVKPVAPLRIESYERLGRMEWSEFLEEYGPDMIICDEAHRLRNVRAAVTRRVGRYMSNHPETCFLALSGTLLRRSLFDFAHLVEWTLGDQSPVPLEWADLQEWGAAVDVGDVRYAPGVLAEFIKGDDGSLEGVREGLRARLVETPGVVATEESPIDAGLLIEEWKPKCAELKEEFSKLYNDWELPSGETLLSAADVWRHARELCLGFYYQWDPQPPEWWLEPRRKWSAFVRSTLIGSRTLDSAAQVADLHQDSKVFRDWSAVRADFIPNRQVFWLDTGIIEQAAQWVRDQKGIVWVGHNAVADRLIKLGVDYYGNMGINRQGKPIEKAVGGIAASIEANKEGRNLQRYSRNLILAPPTTGLAWEQLLGRTHRDGQLADEVTVEVFLRGGENARAITQAITDSRYQKGLTGSPQKLLEATLAFASLEGVRA